MLLSDRDIRHQIDTGRIGLAPHDPALVQPASVDVRLGDRFRIPNPAGPPRVDPDRPQHDLTVEIAIPAGEAFTLAPGGFVLATTLERVTLPADLAARWEGKSSIGRLGLLTHITAGFIDPGFTGQITLELANLSGRPLLLRPGMRIGQLCFLRLTSPADRPYGSPGLGSRYQGQTGPTPSRAHLG